MLAKFIGIQISGAGGIFRHSMVKEMVLHLLENISMNSAKYYDVLNLYCQKII